MKYAAYSEYKTSGSNWLNAVPSHWNVKPLKLIVKMPITDGPHETPEFTPDGVPFASVEAVWDGKVHLSSVRGYISEEDHRRYGKKYHPKRSDIFIVKSGSTTGKIAIVDFDDDFNVWSPLAAVRCDGSQAYPEFVFYALGSSYFQRLVQVSWSFGTQPNIGMGVLGNLPAVLPPVAEQQTIARFLDAKTAQIDELIAKKRQLIAKLKEKRSALIARTVTRGLPPEAAKAAGLEPNPELRDSKVDWIGYIPSDWKVERLRRVCRRVTDGAHISPDLSSDDFPFVSTVDIANGKIDMKNCLRTSVECYEYLVRTGCKPFSGDVLFSKDGTVGRTAVVDFSADFVVASSLVIISPDSRRLDSCFLDYWLNNSLLQQEVMLQMAGAALRRISVEKIGRLPVLLPPPNEQKAIVLYLEEKGGLLETLVTKAEAAIDRLTEYRQALITSAVTGKIDVRGLA